MRGIQTIQGGPKSGTFSIQSIFGTVQDKIKQIPKTRMFPEFLGINIRLQFFVAVNYFFCKLASVLLYPKSQHVVASSSADDFFAI